MYNQQLIIFLALLYKVFAQHIVYVFAGRLTVIEQFTRSQVKRHAVVPRLFVVGSGFVAVPFLGVDMHNNGVVDILNLLKSLNKSTYIIALFHIYIIETEGTKQVVFALPAGGTQF